MINVNFVIDVNFWCDQCRKYVRSMANLPSPDFDDEESNSDTDYVYCPKCGQEHLVEVYCDHIKNYFSAQLHGQEIGDGVPYYDEEIKDEFAWAILNNDHHKIFISQLNNAEELNKNQYALDGLTDTLNIMNYAHVVAAIEGYLGAIFIKYVMTYDDLFQKFILKNTDYKDLKFKVTDIVSDPNFIKNHVKSYLDSFIFHRIDKVKPLYKAVLDCDLGDITWLGKAVQIRHDCVHRAGITQVGKKLEIEEQDVELLIKKARELSINLTASLAILDEVLISQNAEMDFDV